MLKTHGYQSAGWTTSNTATGPSASYAAGSSLTMGSANTTLYAVWISSNLKITPSGSTITTTGSVTEPNGSFTDPIGVTSVGDGTFDECPGLTCVTMGSATPPSLSGTAFNESPRID